MTIPGVTARSLSSRAVRFATDPFEYFGLSLTNMLSVPRDELEQLQTAALQWRFEQLYRSVPMVKKYADKQHFDGITRLEDIVPMLFEHTMYKSYPPSLLESNRFDLLTRWLDKLTAHDLSNLDTAGCEGITDWVVLLDRNSPMRILHSSGTGGAMSFVPMSADEYALYGKNFPIGFLQEFGDPSPAADRIVPGMHVIAPSYRYGANGFTRVTDELARWIAGAESRVHTLHPGRLDSDMLYLAARIRAAKAKGTLAGLRIAPHLLARQSEFQAEQASMAQDMERFLKEITDELAGERVYLLTLWNLLYDLSMTGLERGIRKVFAADSVVCAGGGAKGQVRPDGWERRICEFAGVSRLKEAYGMSELCGVNVMCAHGHYHVTPGLVTFLLDPDTSELLPRTGVVTGRAAFYDLVADSHWGGFISGDEITVHWDGGCRCGAASAYIERNINRYSEKRGGDDKITCAATPEAHREAMEFLTQFDAG